MNRLYPLIIIVIVLITSSCRKDYYGIPEVFVNETFSLSDPSYHLSVAGNFALSNSGGVAGIVVYNTGSGYVAFDRCSTVNPEKRCAVEIGDAGLSLVDPCSNAKYDIRNGAPSLAPAERPLKPYQVRIEGNILRVIN